MIYAFADRRPVPELAPEIERLSRLLQALERIRAGDHPDEAELASAPMIDKWSLADRHTIALVGNVHRHPTIPNARPVCTSDLWFVAPALGYARTLNRFYVLGRQHDMSDRRGFQ